MKFEKGKSGNPNGRPKKGESITDALMTYLAEVKYGKGDGKRALAEKLFALAMDGDVSAIKYIMDSVDGAPRQIAEVKQENDIRIVLDFDTEGL